VGFKPTIPVFEGAETVHALDRANTVIGCPLIYDCINDFTACELGKSTRLRIEADSTLQAMVIVMTRYDRL
jgi:hypothetical protein